MKTPRNKQRGAILILASLFTFFTLLAAITLFKVLPMEFNAAKKSQIDVNAHYAVDAGVKDAVAWLESQPTGRRLTQAMLEDFNSDFGGPTAVSEHWEYTVNIERLEVGHFGITATALFRGRQVREVKAQVVKENLSQYALFIDTWPLVIADGQATAQSLIYSIDDNLVTGPFHTNDLFVLASESLAGSTGGQAFVSGPYAQMTHARTTSVLGDDLEDFVGDGNAYLGRGLAVNNAAQDVPFNAEGAVEQRYQRIVEGGRGNLQVVEHIPFPETAVDSDGVPLREKARGVGNTQFSGQGVLGLGVYVPEDQAGEVLGGVYVVGDSELSLSIDSNGNQIQTVSQAHREEGYFESSEVEVEAPRYVRTETDTPPLFLEQLVTDTVIQRVIVGYEEPTVSAGDGITQPVSVPIYEEREVTVQRVVQVPFEDLTDPPPPPYVVFEEDTDNPFVYTTVVLNPISEEEYDASNPDHVVALQDAGDRVYQVIEVTSEQGYTLPANAQVEGVITNGIVPKDHTVLVDQGTYRVSHGNLNGVTFVDGNIERLSGVNKGALTAGENGLVKPSGRVIVAAPEFGKKLEITGNLLQFYDRGDQLQGPGNTLKTGELPSNADNALGLVAGEIQLSPDYRTSANRPLDIYALILAGSGQMDGQGNPQLVNGRQPTRGGFGTHPELLESGSPLGLGRFRIFGGVIEAEARPWFLSPGGNRIGLEGELHYDPAAAFGFNNFPSIGSVKVVRYSEYVAL